MTQHLYSLVWRITCICIFFARPSWEFGIFGNQPSTPPVPEPEVTTSKVAASTAATTTTPAPFLQPLTTTDQGSLPEPSPTNGTVRLPSHIQAALQLLKTYIAQRVSGTSSNTQSSIDSGQNAVTKDQSSGSLFDILKKQGTGSAPTTGNNTSIPLNSPLPMPFGNDRSSNVPLFNSATGSFVGTGPQINAIGTKKDTNPAKATVFFDLLSQMGEHAQEGSLADIFNTFNALQNGNPNSVTAAMLADIDLPEKSAQTQAKEKPVQQSNTHESHPAACPIANANSASSTSSGSTAQMQQQTGLVLPVDQQTQASQVQSLPDGSNPSLVLSGPGAGNIAPSQSQGYNPYQVQGNPSEVGMSTEVSNTQQTLQTNPHQMLGTPPMPMTSSQPQGDVPLYPQGVRSVQAAGFRGGSSQNWNIPSSQGNSVHTPSSRPYPNWFINQQGFATNQQPLNAQQSNPLTNYGNSARQQSLSGTPVQRQTSSFMSGQTPDPNLDIFQPVFGSGPSQSGQTQPAQAPGGQSGSVIPSDTAGATAQASSASVPNMNQGAYTQLNQIMSGQTADIATYYQTAEGKLIRVIPYQNAQAAGISQLPQTKPFPTQGKTNNPASEVSNANGNLRQGNPKPNTSPQVNQTGAMNRETAQSQYTRLSMRNQRLNPYTVQRRQLRQLPSIRYAQQRPMYQRFQNARTVPVYRRTGYPRQVQAIRYPSVQQVRVPSSANRLGQNRAQLSQFQLQNAQTPSQNFAQQPNYLTVGAIASMQPQGGTQLDERQTSGNTAENQGVFESNGEAKSRSTASNRPVMQVAGINKIIDSPTAQQQMMSNQMQQGGVNSRRFMLPQGASMPFPRRDSSVQRVKSR